MTPRLSVFVFYLVFCLNHCAQARPHIPQYDYRRVREARSLCARRIASILGLPLLHSNSKELLLLGGRLLCELPLHRLQCWDLLILP